jgi:WD40 repeat protein
MANAPCTIYPSLTSKNTLLLKTVALLKGHNDAIHDLSWSPNSQYIATASADRSAVVWDVAAMTSPSLAAEPVSDSAKPPAPSITNDEASTSRPVSLSKAAVVTFNRVVRAVAWSGDGSTLAVAGGDETVTLWDPRNMAVAATLTGHTSVITAISWSPSSQQLASASRDNTVRVWDVDREAGTSSLAATLRGNAEPVNAVDFHPDGLHLASGGSDSKARVWSIAAEAPRTDLSPLGRVRFAVTGVAWSPDGRLLAVIDSIGGMMLWDAQGKTVLHSLEGGNELIHAYTTRPAFSPDGLLLAVPRGEKVAVLGLGEGAWSAAGELEGHAGRVSAVAFSPDGRLLATVSEDGTGRVWGAGRG